MSFVKSIQNHDYVYDKNVITIYAGIVKDIYCQELFFL